MAEKVPPTPASPTPVWWKQHHDWLLSSWEIALCVAYNIVRNWPDAEDIAQSTAMKATDPNRGPHFEVWQACKAWHFTTARRAALKLRRRRAVVLMSSEATEEVADARAPSPLDSLEAAETERQRQRIFESVEQMPDAMRRAFLLRMEGKNYEAIAEALGCCCTSAHNLVKRALVALRRRSSETQ